MPTGPSTGWLASSTAVLASTHGVAPADDLMELALSATRIPSPTATNRDAALDLLRTVALGRVMLWHAFAAPWMTFFAAVPLMFFVAGTLLAESSQGVPYGALMRRRARRVLLPLWVYGAAVAVAGLLREPPGWHTLAAAPTALWHAVTWIVPLVDPAGSEWHGGWLSTHLWYLRAYVWILILVPLLVRLSRSAARSLGVWLVVVAALELCNRLDVPVIGAGLSSVLVGDALTYAGFVLLGMAYRRRCDPLPVRLLAAGSVTAGGATVAYVAFAGLPAGGVNESYAAVALTGITWLLAAGAAQDPIRKLAERPHVRRATEAVTRRAVTVYLWHPAAIVVAYAVLNGSDRFPRMSVVHHWPVPAVLVVILALASTIVATAGLGWVEDLAARRTDSRVVRLAAVVPPAAATLALVVPVANGHAASAASIFAASRPPSFRPALANDAFVGRRPPADDRAPIGRVDPAHARLQAALAKWLAGQPNVHGVAVGLAVSGRTWTGVAHKDGAVNRFAADEEFGSLSMTKTFTTALVLNEVRAGRLSLDAPVPPLPGLHMTGDAAKITVRQLLDHSSGLVEYNAVPGFDASRPLDAREAVELALSTGLQSAPGVAVHYANVNFLHLGLILEHVTGRPYADLLTDLFLAHDLRRSRLGPGGPGWPGFASGGVVSTLSDLARWGDALFTPGRVLPPAEVRQLTTLDDKNMALSMWPICPCGTASDGTKQYSAIGQTVGYGGFLHFPSGMSLVVRIDLTPVPGDAVVVTLGHELQRALRAVASSGRH
jgi:CubicO group peptidase (beta-lactamase class C family)/peptidoglycan/LPS O-acetylase OafA/YrhL